MIAGHEKCAVACTQPRKGRGVRREVLHGTIHQITGDRDEICIERVYCIDDRVDVAALDGATHVDVADLRNRESVQRWRQIAQRNLNALDASAAARICKADPRRPVGCASRDFQFEGTRSKRCEGLRVFSVVATPPIAPKGSGIVSSMVNN